MRTHSRFSTRQPGTPPGRIDRGDRDDRHRGNRTRPRSSLAGVRYYDADAETLEVAATSVELAERTTEVPRVGRGDHVIWNVFAAGEPAIVEDVSSIEFPSHVERSVDSAVFHPLGEHRTLAVATTDGLDVSAIHLVRPRRNGGSGTRPSRPRTRTRRSESEDRNPPRRRLGSRRLSHPSGRVRSDGRSGGGRPGLRRLRRRRRPGWNACKASDVLRVRR